MLPEMERDLVDCAAEGGGLSSSRSRKRKDGKPDVIEPSPGDGGGKVAAEFLVVLRLKTCPIGFCAPLRLLSRRGEGNGDGAGDLIAITRSLQRFCSESYFRSAKC